MVNFHKYNIRNKRHAGKISQAVSARLNQEGRNLPEHLPSSSDLWLEKVLCAAAGPCLVILTVFGVIA